MPPLWPGGARRDPRKLRSNFEVLNHAKIASKKLGIGGPPVSDRVDQIAVEEVFNAWCSLLPTIKKRRDSSPIEHADAS